MIRKEDGKAKSSPASSKTDGGSSCSSSGGGKGGSGSSGGSSGGGKNSGGSGRNSEDEIRRQAEAQITAALKGNESAQTLLDMMEAQRVSYEAALKIGKESEAELYYQRAMALHKYLYKDGGNLHAPSSFDYDDTSL